MSHSILFVHLGPVVPAWAHDAVAQARLFNDCPIHFLANRAALASFPIDPKLGVTTITAESLPVSDGHRRFQEIALSKLDTTFRDGFWTFTTERFFYIEAAMTQHALTHVVHLEYDNLLYVDLETIMPIVRRHYPNMAGTHDCEYRCVPALLYIRGAASLSRLTAFINQTLESAPPNVLNDMYLLGLYRIRHGDEALGQLPVCTSDCPKPLSSVDAGPPPHPSFYWNLIEAFDSVFDANAIGQYLGGIDPRNTGGKDTVGFINETCVFDPSAYTYAWDHDAKHRKVLRMKSPRRAYLLNNVHVHSKNTRAFRSF